MKNKSVEMISATLAIGAILSAFFGYNSHKNERKSTRCQLAHAECVECGDFDYEIEPFSEDDAVLTASLAEKKGKRAKQPATFCKRKIGIRDGSEQRNCRI